MEAKLAPYECGLPIEVLGQMAYYAQCVWNEQFTRTFVPIIFLHGINMDIYLFACSGNRRVVLGRYIKDVKNPMEDAVLSIIDTIRDLWFLLIQPSERFGHLQTFLTWCGSYISAARSAMQQSSVWIARKTRRSR
ncbi:hypothetical protein GGI05_000603 [Coemansia sp. RSA 2603]|nr:hypothetical protein GGI05_000603 [Coemansia sp. RSA 2603]